MKQGLKLQHLGWLAAGLSGLMLAFAVGCGSGSSHSDVEISGEINLNDLILPALQPDGIFQVTTPAETQLLELMKIYFKFRCSTLAECHPSIAAFTSRNPATGLLTCTSFVVGQNRMATNKHCFPVHVKPGDSCRTDVFLFPQTSQYPANAVRCHRVVDVSPDVVHKQLVEKPLGRDYVIVETASVIPRPALTLARSGLPDGMALTYYGSRWMPREKAIVITPIRCTAVMNSAALTLYTSPFSPVIGLPDCMGFPGNSGSPLIDHQNQVRAMINSEITDQKVRVDGFLKDARGMTATNIACLQSSALGLSVASPECDKPVTYRAHAAKMAKFLNPKWEDLPDLKKSVTETYAKWLARNADLPVGSELKFVNGPDEIYAVSRLTCIRANMRGKKFRTIGFQLTGVTTSDEQRRSFFKNENKPVSVQVESATTGEVLTHSDQSNYFTETYSRLPTCPR